MNNQPTPDFLRGSWLVRTLRGAHLVLTEFQVTRAQEFSYDRPPSKFELYAWARDPFLWPSLLEMYEAAYGAATSGRRMTGGTGWLVDRLEDAFRRRHLILVAEDSAPVRAGIGVQASRDRTESAESSQAVRAAVATSEKEEKTWFRARLLDEDGQPIAGEDYILVDTDGVRRQGKLDDNGQVYIPAILPPGKCKISFPNIHLNPRKRK